MPTVTGELHRPQARFSPVNFTEYPRFLMPANRYFTTGEKKAVMVTMRCGRLPSTACWAARAMSYNRTKRSANFETTSALA
jgi:hypothetical protein